MIKKRISGLGPAGLITMLLLTGALMTSPGLVEAEPLTAHAAVERTEVYEGESFTFRIWIEGSDSPETPDLSELEQVFEVESLGGQQNSSSSVTIINGKFSQTVERKYVFSYRLTATRTGAYSISPIQITADGRTAVTEPLSIRVTAPQETEDFKLRIEPSKKTVYVGEPFVLNVKWYIGKNVDDFRFNLPILDDERFTVVLKEPDLQNVNQENAVVVPLGSGKAIAEKAHEKFEGKEFLTVSFDLIVIPKEPGEMEPPKSTVMLRALVGYRKPGGYSRFFDMKRGEYRKFVIPSNPLSLKVLELPSEGGPETFTGAIGRFRLEASAEPTDVNVGDPITFTLKLSGSPYIDHLRLPPFAGLKSFTEDFKIPEEMAPGKTEDDVKVFTQTVRAKRADVQSIPAFEFPYFDPEEGEYKTARSQPIPLHVNPTKVVTAADAEGRAPDEAETSDLHIRTEGITHNYEDLSVLEDHRSGPSAWLKSPAWIALIAAPPLLYLGLFAATAVMRGRREDPGAKRSRTALKNLNDNLGRIQKKSSADSETFYAEVRNELMEYLGAKLSTSSAALTSQEIRELLSGRNIAGALIDELKEITEICDAGRFGGGALGEGRPSELVERVKAVCANLERSLT